MSDKGEHESLLANTDDDPNIDMGQHIAMQQMMGFGSFGSPQRPKRQPKGPGMGRGFGATTKIQPAQSQIPSHTAARSVKLSALSLPFVPASLPPRPPPSQKQGSKTPPATSQSPPNQNLDNGWENPALWSDNPRPASFDLTSPTFPVSGSGTPSQDLRDTDSGQDRIAYTNPVTGFKLTKKELDAYERGVVEDVVNNDGVLTKVKVYFKPNFIEDNPWESLEQKLNALPAPKPNGR